MRGNRTVGVIEVIGLMVGLAVPCRAEIALTGFSSYITGGAEVPTLGWEFTLSQAVTVDRLGLWDYGSDGLVHSHLVTIWSTGTVKTRLVEGTVPSGGSPGSEWRWVSVSPAVLGPGTYRISAVYPIAGPNPDPSLHDRAVGKAASVSTSSPITYVKNVYVNSTGYPSNTYPAEEKGYFGPNFSFVPEPAGLQLPLLLATSGILGGLVRRRRR